MGRSGTLLSPILVGRDGHLELAESRLSDAAAGHGRTFLIAGEAGIGKTRFLHAVLRRARALGFLVAKADIAPQDRDLPGALILDLARTMRDEPLLAATGEDILGRWRAAVEGEGAAGRWLVRDIAEAIVSATDRPLVLAFEDVQWADDRSLELIAELARIGARRRIALIAVHRREGTNEDGHLRAWRSRLLTQRLADAIHLDRLTLAQTATMVTLLLDSGLPAPRDLAAAVHERSDGLPLHIEELMAAVRARGPIDVTAVRSIGVPDTIEDAVLARTAELTPEAQAVARAGAVLGRCFVPDVLAGVMGVSVAQLEAPLEELVEHAVLFPFGARDQGYHDFRHQLLREALYRHTPARERRRYHARAAEFGGRLEGQSVVHASLHYARAGLREEAFRTALAGAEEARRVLAHREAFELYQRAIEHEPPDLDPAVRADLHRSLAIEALALEDMSVAGSAALAAAAAFRSAGDEVQAIGAMTLLLVLWRRDGHAIDDRIGLGRRLLAELDALPGTTHTEELRSDLLVYLAHALIDAQALDDARSILASTRSSAGRLEAEDLRLVVEQLEAVIQFQAGDAEGGLGRLEAAAVAGVEQRLETPALLGLRETAIMAVQALDYPRARRAIDAGIRFGAEVEQAHCAQVMTGVRALVDWATGDWDRAAETARQVLADRGCRRAATAATIALAYVGMARDDLAAAVAGLDGVSAWAEVGGVADAWAAARWGLAEAALLAGDANAAIEHCRAAVEHGRAHGERMLLVPFVVTGVRSLQVARRPAEAERFLADLSALLDPVGAVAGPALEHGTGLVALAGGSTGLARRSLEAAVAGWDARGRTWEAMWARLDLAACLIRSDRFAAAAALAAQVHETGTRLGAPVLVERAAAVARQGRGRFDAHAPWYPLTSREFEVARLVGAGRTNAEIAEELGIAPKTASSHVEHILAKLGAARRTEIAAWASQVGSVPAGR